MNGEFWTGGEGPEDKNRTEPELDKMNAQTPVDERPAYQPVDYGAPYYYQEYNPEWQQRSQYAAMPQPKKSRGGITALIVILLVVCLAGGVAAGTFLIAPNMQKIAQNLPGGLVPIQPDNSAVEESPTQSVEVPEIGGQAPNIVASESPIVQIAKEVSPAIVGVTVSVNQPVMGQRESEEAESGYGTGIILREDGYIVTNNHVISGSDHVKITLFDGSEYKAKVVGIDATTDLAVLKIEADGLRAAALGDSDALQVGEGVVAIGNPLGATLAGSVTSGIVSALNRDITTNGFSQTYIQTDAAINPGNSGGALVNMKGDVIGINTLKSYLAGYDNYGVPIGTEGIGFAIPINSAKPIIEQLIATGSVQRPGIGISCLVDETNAYNPVGSPEGVTVVEVVSGGPADTAGLKAGDIILTINGTPTLTVEELTNQIQQVSIGTQLELTVWRSGQEYKAIVIVGDLNKMH